jgi:hypothetical protein
MIQVYKSKTSNNNNDNNICYNDCSAGESILCIVDSIVCGVYGI